MNAMHIFLPLVVVLILSMWHLAGSCEDEVVLDTTPFYEWLRQGTDNPAVGWTVFWRKTEND